MAYQNPEIPVEQTPRDMRISALGLAIINLETAYFNSNKTVQLPNLPGVSYLGKDLEG